MSLKNEFDALVNAMTIDDMPNEDLKTVADICGPSVAISLIKNFEGINIYIPKRGVFLRIAERFIIDKFDGTNAKTLALACKLSQRAVYTIVEYEDKKRKSKRVKTVQ